MVHYDPSSFWLERGKVYYDNFKYNKIFRLQEEALLDHLHYNSSFSSVFEIGCGFGRITKLILSRFPNITEYSAIDISPDQIENAKKYIGGPIKDMKLKVADVKSIQADRRYDLVIAVEVLMHILPSDIVQVVSKLVELSRHNIINIDFYDDVSIKPRLAPHNFIHQYEEIYRNIPDVISVKRVPIVKHGSFFSRINSKQSIFHAIVDRADVPSQ